MEQLLQVKDKIEKVSNKEEHFSSPEVINDLVLGMSDGLTVPFALAAGLTGAIAASGLVVTAGLAEIAAGSISMGLGGYLAAKSQAEHYDRERRVEEHEIESQPDVEAQEIRDIFGKYGIKSGIDSMIKELRQDPKLWVDFMMRNELGLERPSERRARSSAITIASAYVIGGLVPLSPYFFIHEARLAVIPSVIVTLVVLFTFGFAKAFVSGVSPLKSAIQTTIVGAVAATAAFILARLVSGG
jgi:vacuolar iron transporter family protein